MKEKLLFTIVIILCCHFSQAQLDRGNELEQYNIYVVPQPQIEVKLSFNSRYMRNDPRAFSVTPGRESIDMMGVYKERHNLEEKEYTPYAVAHFEKKRQENQPNPLSRPVSLTGQNPFYNNSNFAWQQLRRQSYFNQLYRPIYRY